MTNFGKDKKDGDLIFVILDNSCRVKGAIKIFWRKQAPIMTYVK